MAIHEAARPRRAAGWRRWLLALSGLLPLLPMLDRPPDPTLLIYALFVALWLARRGVPASPPRPARFALALLAGGLLLECLAWTNNFLECNPDPALLHPQLLADLTLALGFYGSWAVAWLLILRRLRFGVAALFVAQGLFGVFVEQQGAVFLLGLMSFPLGLVFWLYVFAVYGSVVGIAALAAGVPQGPAARASRWKLPLALLALLVVLLPASLGWGALAQGAGLIPPRGPICERPLF